jgi:hypothetical protein
VRVSTIPSVDKPEEDGPVVEATIMERIHKYLQM